MNRFHTWANKYLSPTDRLIGEAFERSMSRAPGGTPGAPARYLCDPRVVKSFCPPGASSADWLLQFGRRCFRDKNSTDKEMVFAGLATQGVRVYAPTLNECLALMRVELNIPISAYRQTFETLAVVFPDELYPRPVSSDVGRPFAIVGRYCPEKFGCLSVLIPGDAAYDLSGRYDFATADPDALVEGYLEACPGTGEADAGEAATISNCLRLFINANLLLTQYGAKRLGTSPPDLEAALSKTIRDGNRADRRAAERELKALPVVYGIDQDVKVYETEGFGAGPGEAGGWHVKPHWRRGHWAMVACGAGHRDRRRVFRPAVMVNADRFGGAPADTRAVYTTGGAA